jgi:hypothetical protein
LDVVGTALAYAIVYAKAIKKMPFPSRKDAFLKTITKLFEVI